MSNRHLVTRFMLTTAVLLAGGRGTRLRPFTLHRPKPMMPIANRPVMDYVLEILERNRVVEEVLVLLDYMGESVDEYLKERGSTLEVRSLKFKSLDTADAVRRARNHIEGDFLVMMCDIITNCDLESLCRYHESKRGLATIALRDVDRPHHYGLAIVDPDDRIVSFMEKPMAYELYVASVMMSWRRAKYLHANLANMGIYAFSYDVLDILDDNPYLLDFGRHVFPYLAESGYPIYGWYAGGCYWIDVGVPDAYLQANFDVVDGLAAPLRPRGVGAEGLWLGEGVDVRGLLKSPAALGDDVLIERRAVVGPYAILGNGVRVKEGAEVYESVVLNNAVIGRGSIVKGSVVGEGSVVEEGAYVVRALIEDGAKVVRGTHITGVAYTKKVAAKAVVPIE